MEIYLADPSGVGMVLPKYGRNSRDSITFKPSIFKFQTSFWGCP